jgi:hypothetical protein
LYKEKAETKCPNNYRGIIPENNALKTFTNILTKRLMEEVDDLQVHIIYKRVFAICNSAHLI